MLTHDGPEVRFCEDQELSLANLAQLQLPAHSWPSRLFQEYFGTADAFCDAVQALEQAGQLPTRDPPSYRAWDAYYILHLLLWDTRTVIERGGGWSHYSPVWAEALPQVISLEKDWWPAIGAVHGGFVNEAKERTDLSLAIDAGQVLESEWEPRASQIRAQLIREIDQLAADLPDDRSRWQAQLREMSSLVLALRSRNFDRLARLADQHLQCAEEIAQRRLGVDRRGLRDLVGLVNEDLRWPALTAAAYSHELRAVDVATDQIVDDLPEYNGAFGDDFKLTPADVDALLAFLTETGLAQWPMELSIVGWHDDSFLDLSESQQRSVVFGRVRTLCVLLEEAVPTLAARRGGESFGYEVEMQWALFNKIKYFVGGPDRSLGLVLPQTMQDLNTAYNVLKERRDVGPNFAAALSQSFSGYGMPCEADISAALPPSPEQVLAGVAFVRNLTSHHFPMASESRSTRWQQAWADHLPAINRTVRWAMLILWAIARRFPDVD